MNKKLKSGKGLYLGRVAFSGYGGFQERLISELLELHIPLRGVTITETAISGEASPLDYYRISEIARKHGVRLKSGRRRGLYFLLNRYRKRAGLYVGALVMFSLLTIMQAHVCDITIEGDVPKAQVMEILERCGIVVGAERQGISGALYQAEQELLLNIENCAWADVSIDGFRVYVTVEQGTPMPEIEDNTQPRNIIATRSAVIVEQKVRKGIAVLNVGSGVQKGGLLVSGTVADGGGHILYLRSDAVVIGEFTETQEFFVPYNETLHLADGERTEYKYLVYMDDEYPLFFGSATAENAVRSEETALVRLFGENTPFKLKTVTYTAYRDVDVTRTGEECVDKLRQMKSDFEQNFYSEYEIVNTTEKFLPEKDGVRLILDYTLRGDITQPVDIAVDIPAE